MADDRPAAGDLCAGAGVLLHLPGPAYPWLLASLAVGTPALSMLGAFGAAVTVRAAARSLLMSLLVLPLWRADADLRGRGGGGGRRRRGCVTPLVFSGRDHAGGAGTGALASAAALRVNPR